MLGLEKLSKQYSENTEKPVNRAIWEVRIVPFLSAR